MYQTNPVYEEIQVSNIAHHSSVDKDRPDKSRFLGQYRIKNMYSYFQSGLYG